MLTVGLDLRGVSPEFKEHFGRGTGRYAMELSRCLLGCNAEENGCAVLPLYLDSLTASPWQQTILRLAPAGRQTLETQVFLPGRFKRLPVDVIHFLAHGDATARCKKPYLVTVLDLIPLRFPELYKAIRPSWRYHLARYFENSAAKNAKGVLAISEATKRDVMDFFGFADEQVVVTHLGVSSYFTPRGKNWREHTAQVKRNFGLDPAGPLLLYSGGIDPRKNLSFLLQVFSEVRRNVAPHLSPVLGLVGRMKESDRYSSLKADIRTLGLEDSVHEFGFVTEEQLRSLYMASDLYVFPSLYEGFGLPVLEAMASGVPVVAGNNSSIPEVAGDAAVLLADNDLSSWVNETISLLSSTGRQEDLSERGIRRAQLFTWEKTAQRTLEAYKYFDAQWAWSANQKGNIFVGQEMVEKRRKSGL